MRAGAAFEALGVGHVVGGPAVLADGTQTIVVPPTAEALVTEMHVVLEAREGGDGTEGHTLFGASRRSPPKPTVVALCSLWLLSPPSVFLHEA